mgnify:CR=1 FL=1
MAIPDKEIPTKTKTNPIITITQTKINKIIIPRQVQLFRIMEIKLQLRLGIILRLWLELDLLYPEN